MTVAEMVGGVYKLKLQMEQKCLLTVTSDVWHRRLGHVNNSDFEKMRNGSVDGINCSDKNNRGMCNCFICYEGKQTRLPFKNIGTRARKPLEVIHGDDFGPMEPITVGESKYIFLLVDDYTRMSFIYCLRRI